MCDFKLKAGIKLLRTPSRQILIFSHEGHARISLGWNLYSNKNLFQHLIVLTTNLISCFKTKFYLELLVTIASSSGSIHPYRPPSSLQFHHGKVKIRSTVLLFFTWTIITLCLLAAWCLPGQAFGCPLPCLLSPMALFGVLGCPLGQPVSPALPHGFTMARGRQPLTVWLNLCFSKAVGFLSELHRYFRSILHRYCIYWCKWRSVVAGMITTQCKCYKWSWGTLPNRG